MILILFAQFIQISLSQTMSPACIPVMDIWRISLLKMIIKCLNLDVQCCYTNLSALPWGLFISSFDSCHEASIIWFLLWNNQTNGLNALWNSLKCAKLFTHPPAGIWLLVLKVKNGNIRANPKVTINTRERHYWPYWCFHC